MSSATTTHDGCGDIVNLFLLCIILIVFMSIRHYCLCTCIFILHSLHSLLIRVQKQPKQVKICHLEETSKADLLNICAFFYIEIQKMIKSDM